MIADDYEISLWEDYLYTPTNVSDLTLRVSSFYKERKLATIGSNTMTSECRAINPVLIENINGTKTFTFKIPYNCREDSYQDATQYLTTIGREIGTYDSFYDVNNSQILFGGPRVNTRLYKNPFLQYLVNERKVKVKWKGNWYDFVIKSCQENSADKTITYTCEDSYVTELSKTGFNIELNTDLQNNQGNVRELAGEILKYTSWEVETTDTSFLKEKREDAVYELTLLEDLPVDVDLTFSRVTIPAQEKVLLYYTQIQELCRAAASDNPELSSRTLLNCNYLQFAYAENYEYNLSTGLVTNASFYHTTVKYASRHNMDGIPIEFNIYTADGQTLLGTINLENGVSQTYRAERLIRKQKSVFDKRTEKYCDVFMATGADINNLMAAGDIIYKYRSVEYRDPTVVNNLIVNPKDFASTSGWVGDNISFKLYSPASGEYESVLTLAAIEGETNFYYNNGLNMLSSYIPEGFAAGEDYVFRYRARYADSSILDPISPTALRLRVLKYTYDGSGNIIPDISGGEYFDDITPEVIYDIDDPWRVRTLRCKKSVTRNDIYQDKVGIFITVGSNDILLEEAQFFKYCLDSNGTIICPGEMGKDSIVNIVYTYFNHTRTPLNVGVEDITKIWEGTEDWENEESLLTPIYYPNYEKIRSITAKQSNCLNLLKNLAEIFECRFEFYIPHESNGELIYNEGANRESSTWYGKPEKYLRILPMEGEEIGYGFIYGIDLKTINRTIKSDQIVTKMIVLTNTNELAEDGICAIERSHENFPRTNFILNFDYFINQHFLERADLYNDLYNTAYIGYYFWLNRYNSQYDELTKELIHKKQDLTKKQSFFAVCNSAISSINDEIQVVKDELMKILGLTWDEVEEYIETNYDNPESISEPVLTRITAYINYTQMLSEYTQMFEDLNLSIQNLNSAISIIQSQQANLLELVRRKDVEFYQKYSRFLREGCWSGKEYINDDLYYFDAVKNAKTSSKPVVSYNISVMRVSALEEFKNKVFRVGDISFIQDTDFFGYTRVMGIETPYKEKVTVTEITSNFDEPDKDTFKVQNYKTEFEDLFQRITGSIQSLEFNKASKYR